MVKRLSCLLALAGLLFAGGAARQVDFLVRQSTPASARIVERDSVHLGWFDRPFEHPGVRTGILRSPLRGKEWQYISLTSDRYIVGMSCVDVGYLSNFFLFVFDFQERRYIEFEDKGITGRRASVAANSLTGATRYRSRRCAMTVENRYKEGYYLVSFACRDKNQNRVEGTVTIHVQGEPLVNIREVARARLVYTHQSAIYRPEGSLIWNGDTITFDPLRDFSSFDYTRGRHRYRTTWNWASGGGRSADGTPVAITFSTGTGYFYWVAGKLYRIPELSFEYASIDEPWKLSAADKTVRLTFTPCGKRVGKTNVLGLLMSDYRQPFGTFTGSIRLPEGRVVDIATLRGVTEEHIAKW